MKKLRQKTQNKKLSLICATIFVLAISAYLISHFDSAQAVFPTNSNVLDNFNRADTTTLSGQTSSSGNVWATQIINNGSTTELGITANQAYMSGISNLNGYIDTQFGPDSEVYVEIPDVPDDGNYFALWSRVQTPGSGQFDAYGLIYIHSTSGNATWSLRRYDNSSGTVLSNISATAINFGDTVGLEITGTGSTVTVTAYRKTGGTWSTVGSVNDTSVDRITAAGYLGLELQNNTMRLDNFAGGTLVTNQSPAVPSGSGLSAPADGSSGVSITPQFQVRTTDADNDYLRYKIDICSSSDCSNIVRTVDQTLSQTGWSGQDTQGNTAYIGSSVLTSSTLAVYTYQSPVLGPGTRYWWRAYAIDPGGLNVFSSASSILSFTTEAIPNPSPTSPSSNDGVIKNGTKLK